MPRVRIGHEMIELDKLTDADLGRAVIYRTFGKSEFGTINSWNKTFIFVRYHECQYADGTYRKRYGETSEATSPRDLDFTS